MQFVLPYVRPVQHYEKNRKHFSFWNKSGSTGDRRNIIETEANEPIYESYIDSKITNTCKSREKNRKLKSESDDVEVFMEFFKKKKKKKKKKKIKQNKTTVEYFRIIWL